MKGIARKKRTAFDNLSEIEWNEDFDKNRFRPNLSNCSAKSGNDCVHSEKSLKEIHFDYSSSILASSFQCDR